MKRLLSVFVCTGALVAWFFAPALGGGFGFAFRDAAHYYRPLFEYLRAEWLAGRPPLWNSYENIGVPLVAQNTSSVFYPGKLLFALPLDYALLYHLYIALHVVLAAATSYALARHARAGRLAAGLAGIAYAFSGSVLFQYCNVVFLVGAAWLPLALLAADRMLQTRRLGAAAGFGAVLALMVLGGDPQMAYNAVLLAGLWGLLQWREEKRDRGQADRARPALLSRRAVLFGMALALAGGLAAVQVLPTLEAAPHSRRARYDAPRNIYELAVSRPRPSAGEPPAGWYEGLIGRTDGGHERQIYQFSVAPVRLVELVWPNVTGRAFPVNRRWLAALGAESTAWDLWTPSLYMGLLPFVLAVSEWSVRRGAAIDVRFFSWTALIGVAASLGFYGVASAVTPLLDGTTAGDVGPEVGGLYWWLTVVLPGYVYFRFPAKWFVVASLGLSMLAARGWDRAWLGASRPRFGFGALLGLSLLGLGAVPLLWSVIRRHAVSAPALPILGPFDVEGARADLVGALLHTTVLSVAFLALLLVGRRRPQWRAWAAIGALLLTALDLGVAQRCLMLYAPAEDWLVPPEAMELASGEQGARLFRQLGPLPSEWETTSSAERFSESVRWDRRTLWPKYPLPHRVGMVEASETIIADDYRVLLDVARRYNSQAGGSVLPHASVLDLLGAQVAIVDRAAAHVDSGAETLAGDMVVHDRPRALPRAWIVHRVEVLPTLAGCAPAAVRDRTEAVLFPGGETRDWREVAVVECDEPLTIDPRCGHLPQGETCRIVEVSPQHVEIEAHLAAEGIVVLSDLYYPGWELIVESGGESRRLPILRTNRVMRGVRLPGGTHRLVYRYRPASVFYGAAISGCSVLLLCAALACALVRRRGDQ